MKKRAAQKGICFVLMGIILVVCGYLWFCMAAARFSGNPLEIAGYRIIVTDWALSDTLPENTLLAMGPAEEPDRGDVLLVRGETDSPAETVCQVLLVTEDKIWVSYEKDILPRQLSPDAVLGTAALVSPELGQFVLFLSTPAGIAVAVLIPLSLVFLLQTAVVLLRRRERADQGSENSRE